MFYFRQKDQTLSTLHVLVRLNPRNILAVADVEIATEVRYIRPKKLKMNCLKFKFCFCFFCLFRQEFLKCLQQPGVSLLDVINLIGALADVERTRNEIVSKC